MKRIFRFKDLSQRNRRTVRGGEMNLAYESCKYSRKAPHFLSEIIFINMGVMASHTCVVID